MRRFIILLMVFGLVVAACGGDDDTSDTTAAPTTTAAATTQAPDTTAAAGDAELRWRTRPDNQEEADVYQTISDQLAGELGVTLTYEPGASEGADYQTALQTELSAGTAPDVFWIPGTDIATFATAGLILDLRDLASAAGHNDADFYPGPMFHLTYDPDTDSAGGPLWGLPRDVSTFALYINNDLIAEAGADDPRVLAANGEWTWEKFEEVSEAVAAISPEIKGYGQSTWWGPYGFWVNSGGGSFFNADRTACALDTPEALSGLGFLADFYAGGSAVTYGEDAEAPFRAGNVGMFQNGRWATPGIRTVDFDWDVVTLPAGPEGPQGNWLFWGAYVVNADTADPQAAWSLVQSLTRADVQAQISALGANIPSRVSQEALDAFLGFSPPANNQAFLDGLAQDPATEGPVWAGDWPALTSLMDPEITELVTGATTIDDFAASICTTLNTTFSG